MFYKRIIFENEKLITEQLQHEFTDYKKVNIIHSELCDNLRLNCAPDLVKQLKSFNLNLLITRIFITPGDTEIPVHRDGNIIYPKFVALNWPIFNCQDSIMYWYNLRNQDTVPRISTDPRYVQNNTYNFRYSPIDCEVQDQLNLISPHLVDINSLHNVRNFSNDVRVILSLRFDPEPFHLFPKAEENLLQGPY